MRNVSNAFKERMNDRRDFYATAEITFADGTVKNLTKADFNIQGNSVIQGGATSSFSLGVLSSKQITLSLLNNDDKWEEYGFYNAQIKLATNYQTNEPDPESSDGFTPVIERLQEGIFTVITPETYGTTIEITAMDESYKTDKEYTSSIQFPARLDDALRDCCANCGITLYSDDIPNKDFIIKKKPEGISFRDFIGNCAMVAGGNAIMDNYNRLKIITYDFSVFSDQEQAARIPLLKDFKPGLRLEAIDVEITGLQITGEITETDEEGNETTTTETFKYGEDGYVLTLTNELAAGNEEAFLRSVGDIIVGSRFRAFSGDSIADPLIEFMDAVYIRDYKGRVFQSFISDIDFSYFGTTVIKCSADSPLRNGQSGGRDPVKHLKQLIEKEKTEREKALERLNQMLKDSSGIYTTAEEQPDGSVIMYIHNKPTIKESKYVIKITGEAMGISNDGGETYIYGLSYDGEAILRKIYAEGIDADYITTGHLSADRILGGTLELGGWNNENGVLKIIDENGDIIGTWDKDGITIIKGKISSDLIQGGTLTLGGLNNKNGSLKVLDKNNDLIGKWDNNGLSVFVGSFPKDSEIDNLSQEVKGLNISISDANKNIASLQQTSTSIKTQVEDAKKNITSLQQTATNITTQVEDAKKNITTVTQTAQKINWLVKSGTNETNFTLTDRAISLVSSKIDLTGYVTISNLKTSGKTEINGGNITAGTIDAAKVNVKNLNINNVLFDNAVVIECAGSATDTTINIGRMLKFNTTTTSTATKTAIHGKTITIGDLLGLTASSYGVSIVSENITLKNSSTVSYVYKDNAVYCTSTSSLGTSSYAWASAYIKALTLSGTTPTIKSTNNITITVGSMNYTLSTALYSTNSSSSLGTSSYAWASAYIKALTLSGTTPTIKSTNNITITVGSMNYTLSTALYSTNSSSSLGTSSYAWANAYIKALTASGNVTLGSSTNSSVSIASGYNCYLGFFGTRPVSRKQVSTVPTNGTLTNAITGINNIISALKGYGLIS